MLYDNENSAMLKQASEQCVPGTNQYIPPTRRQQLQNKKAALEHGLKIVNAAIAALDAHPDLEEFAETLARAL